MADLTGSIRKVLTRGNDPLPKPPPGKPLAQPRPHKTGDPALHKEDVVGRIPVGRPDKSGNYKSLTMRRKHQAYWRGPQATSDRTEGELEAGRRRHLRRVSASKGRG